MLLLLSARKEGVSTYVVPRGSYTSRLARNNERKSASGSYSPLSSPEGVPERVHPAEEVIG